MSRRIPLWATLIPLAIGLAVYASYWFKQRDAFQAELQAIFGADAPISYGGFPYRLEATVERPQLRHEDEATFAQFSASRLVLNRQPWRPALTIISADDTRVQLVVPGLAGARLDIEAAESLSSLNLDDGRVTRLSTTYENARLWSGLLPAPVTASHFEIHLRETPGEADAASRAPTFPRQAQVVLNGEQVRVGGGDPLQFEADIALTAQAPIRSVAGWRAGGTAEVTKLSLRDKTGVVLDMNATAVPMPNGRLMLSGTVETVCPFTLRAAFRGRRAEPEMRARKPVRLAFRGQPGDFDLVEPAGGLSRVPVRNQVPPCPVLRR